MEVYMWADTPMHTVDVPFEFFLLTDITIMQLQNSAKNQTNKQTDTTTLKSKAKHENIL